MAVRQEALKTRLLAKKEQLEAQVKNTPTVAITSVGYGNHMADDATFAHEQTKELSLQQNVKGLLAEVDQALQRFDQGTYGVCVSCGQCIDAARLRAIPYAPLCITCAQSQSY
jgi:DnaK suppressor protein